jgi:hypothetical protein
MTIKTNIVFGRSFSDDETVKLDAKIAELVIAEVTDGEVVRTEAPDSSPRNPRIIGTRIWTTEEAANQWIAFMSAFTPGPLVATVDIE